VLHRRITLGLLMTVFAVAAHGEERVLEERVMEQRVMEEIIVLAQKREQPLLDVLISISTLSAEELEAAGVYNIDDISRLVPNLEVQTNVNAVQSTFRIRRVCTRTKRASQGSQSDLSGTPI
jgi:outer membrane receptor protein involved in Fe transport